MKKPSIDPIDFKNRQSPTETDKRHGRARRRLLQSLAAGGAAVTVKALPQQWAKPVLDVTSLPAHAQATCQVESLNCAVNDVDFQGDGHADISAAPPLVGGNNTIVDADVDSLADVAFADCGGTAFLNDQTDVISLGVTATVNPPCPVVTLMADLAGDSVFDFPDGDQSQVGVVDPTTGSVTFSNVNIGFDLSSYTVPVTPSTVSALLDLRVKAPGVSDCIINIQFSESFDACICLAKSTLVSLPDGTRKPIEELDYSDELLVWNFDLARFAKARPLYIKRPETTTRYNLLVFSDNSTLKTINQHRIFNKEKGRFTYPMTADTPIGTHTFNVQGEEVRLVHKEIVHEQVEYYNVITDYHLNLFGNGILTSVGYNNLYPIVDMKFVKDDRAVIPRAAYGDIPDKYYHGLRLAEQRDIPVEDTRHYIAVREALAKEPQPGSGQSPIASDRENEHQLRV